MGAIQITCADGSVKQILLLGSWAGTRVLVNFSDITERKKSEKLAIHMSQHDLLTGLANMHLFADRLEQTISLAKRNKRRFAVLFIDLNKFKNVNDTLGHNVGDILLKESAIRIRECLRESDVAARIGGDEFLVLLHDINNEQNAVLVSKKICFMLSQPFLINGETIEISASVGVAIYPEHGDTSEALLKNADHAMYTAKADPANFFRVVNS